MGIMKGEDREEREKMIMERRGGGGGGMVEDWEKREVEGSSWGEKEIERE